MNNDDFYGDRFQELSRYSRNKIFRGAKPEVRPGPFKEYPKAKKTSILLDGLPKGSLWEALQNRRSRRAFTGEPIDLKTLSKLVWACQGATAAAGPYLLRTAPSAGALYPVETYVLPNFVNNIEPGVYHYNIRTVELEAIRTGDLGRELAEASLGQGMCHRASAVFCWTAIIDRCKYKYGQRAYRYIYLDAGHICENLYLAAEDLGLGCCGIGAFFDEDINNILEVDGKDETVVYIAAVGPVKEGRDEP